MSEELKAAPARIAELEGALSWHEEQRNDMAELRAELEHRNKLISDMQAAWDMALHTIGRQNAELAALKAQEPVAYISGCYRDVIGGKSDRTPLGAELAFVNMGWIGQIPLYASPVSEAKARGVVQWPDADEIMQMAFEEGQPADDASGYCFELEEFDLFIERLMSEVARLNASLVQQASVPDERANFESEYLKANYPRVHSGELSAPPIFGQTGKGEYEDDDMQKCWVMWQARAMLAAAPAAPAADAGMVEALDYQVLFDAIAAATSVYANGAINISVQAFRDALAAHRAKGVV